MNQLTAENFDQNARAALQDTQLRGALRNLADTFGERRKAAIETVENWQGLRDRARAVKDETLLHLDKYLTEFAENAEIINMLRNIGVDYAQGYGIATPQRITKIAAFG